MVVWVLVGVGGTDNLTSRRGCWLVVLVLVLGGVGCWVVSGVGCRVLGVGVGDGGCG